jgi:hypothetical protein
MKNKLFSIIAVLTVIAVGLALQFGIGLIFGAGLSLAFAASSGTVDTEVMNANEADFLRPEISQKVTQMNKSRTPLNVILSMTKPVKCKSFKYEFYAVENRPFTDTVNGAYNGNGAYETAAVTVDNIAMWAKHDLAMIQGSVGDDGSEVVLYIYDKDVENNQIKVQSVNKLGTGPLATKNVVPSIANDAVLTRLGQAKNELDAQTAVVTMLPDKTEQYLQIFMSQIEEGEYASMHNKEVDYSFLDYAKQQLYDFNATKELTLLFGFKAYITDKLDSRKKYLTGGATRYVGTDLEYGTGSVDRTYTHDNLIDHSKSIFAANSGSSTRVMFGGSDVTASLMKLKKIEDAASDVTVDYIIKNLTGEETKVTYGIEFKAIRTNFGTMYYYYHPLFDEAGWEDNILVLDLANIDFLEYIPLRKRSIDLKGSGQSLAQAQVLEQICGLAVRYPDTHAIIKPKS